MAVTRIWPIKNNIHQVVSYAANKNKTDLSKLNKSSKNGCFYGFEDTNPMLAKLRTWETQALVCPRFNTDRK